MLAIDKFNLNQQQPTNDNTIVSVLQKPHDKRSQEEIDLLVVLIKNLEFFKTREIKEKHYPEIVPCLKLQKFKTGDFVFHKGDEGQHFYIIISGTISVQMPNKTKIEKVKKLKEEVVEYLKFATRKKRKESTSSRKSSNHSVVSGSQSNASDDEDQHSETGSSKNDKEKGAKTPARKNSTASNHSNKSNHEHRNSGMHKRMGSVGNFENMNPVQKLEYWEQEPDLIEVVRLYKGMSFGELALIDNKPRAATIKCESDCIFATMERSDYTKTLSRIENRNINKVIDFFKDLPYFENYGRAALNKIRFNFSRIKFKRKHIIYKEGDPSDFVYIVINGDFELEKKIKCVDNKEMNYKKYISSNILGEKVIGHKSSRSEVDPKVAKFTKNKALTNNAEYNESYRIALLSKGQMFGDQDAFYDRPYQATVICRSNDGELYQITKENFKKLKNHGD